MSPRRRIGWGSPFGAAYGSSRAVVRDGFMFVAGATGYDGATMTMPASAADPVEACWRTIAGVLAEAGAALAVCGRARAQISPAATLPIGAGLLRPEMTVEIGVTAKRP